jgi:hypothetical protein
MVAPRGKRRGIGEVKEQYNGLRQARLKSRPNMGRLCGIHDLAISEIKSYKY